MLHTFRHPTSRSGKVSFSRRMERCTRPSGLNASSAVGVLRCSGVCETGQCSGVLHEPTLIMRDTTTATYEVCQRGPQGHSSFTAAGLQGVKELAVF